MSKENVYALHLSVLRERGRYVFNCKPNASMFLIAYHDIETIFDQYLDEAYSYGLMEYLFENLNIKDLSRIPEDEIIRLDQWRIVITSKDIVETDRNFSNQRRNLTILVGSKEQLTILIDAGEGVRRDVRTLVRAISPQAANQSYSVPILRIRAFLRNP